MPQIDAPQTDHILNSGERILTEFQASAGLYWRAHGIMAVVFMALAGGVLWLTQTPYPAIGSLGAIVAVAVRAFYLSSEALGFRWVLTNQRLLFPGGERSVALLDIETAREFFGSVQIITQSGDKFLLRYLANGAAVSQQILEARAKRANRRGA